MVERIVERKFRHGEDIPPAERGAATSAMCHRGTQSNAGAEDDNDDTSSTPAPAKKTPPKKSPAKKAAKKAAKKSLPTKSNEKDDA